MNLNINNTLGVIAKVAFGLNALGIAMVAGIRAHRNDSFVLKCIQLIERHFGLQFVKVHTHLPAQISTVVILNSNRLGKVIRELRVYRAQFKKEKLGNRCLAGRQIILVPCKRREAYESDKYEEAIEHCITN